MLFTLGVSAQVKSLDELSPEKTYTIRNPHHNAYAIYERSKSATKVWIGGVTKGIVKNVSYRAAVDTTSPSAAWMIVKHNNKWYAFNMQAKKLLSVGNTIASTGTIYAKLDNDAEPLDIKPQGNGTFTILTTRGSNQYLNATPDLGYPVSVRGLDNGSTWEFKEVKEVAPNYNACMKAIKASMPTTFDLNIANGFAWAGSSTSRKQLPHELAKGKHLLCECTQGLDLPRRTHDRQWFRDLHSERHQGRRRGDSHHHPCQQGHGNHHGDRQLAT